MIADAGTYLESRRAGGARVPFAQGYSHACNNNPKSIPAPALLNKIPLHYKQLFLTMSYNRVLNARNRKASFIDIPKQVALKYYFKNRFIVNISKLHYHGTW